MNDSSEKACIKKVAYKWFFDRKRQQADKTCTLVKLQYCLMLSHGKTICASLKCKWHSRKNKKKQKKKVKTVKLN